MLRVAGDIAKTAEPPDGTVYFVNDERTGLVHKATTLFNDDTSNDVTDVDRGNIDVAMRLDAFRALLLLACLDQIAEGVEG